MAVRSPLLLAVVVLCATSPALAQDAAAGVPDPLPWVVFVPVIDKTAAGLGKKVENLVKQSLLKTDVNVVPTEDLVGQARKKNIPKRRYEESGALNAVGVEAGADFLLFARLTSTSRYAYELELYAVDARSGETVASQRLEAAGDIGRGKSSGGPSGSEIDALVQKLIAALPKPTAPAPPATGDVDAGPAAAAADAGPAVTASEDWGGGFDDPVDTPAGGGAAPVEEVGASTILRELQADFGGRIGVDTFAYVNDLFYEPPVEAGIEKVSSRQQVDLALRASVGSRVASGNAALLLRKDFADPTRDRLEAEEAYADVDVFGVRLRGGRSYITWGTVDLVSPTDILSPFDYRDLLDVEKLPTWHARLAWGIGPLTLEAYYLPLIEPHKLPLIEDIDADDGRLAGSNRWVKGDVGVDPRQERVPLNFRLNLGQVPPPSLANAQLAARARASLFGVDTSIGFASLYDRFPALITRAVAAEPLPLFADVTVSDRLLRRNLVTFDVEATFGKLRVAGEGLLAVQEDFEDPQKECAGADECELIVEDSYMTVALGVDWETPRFLDDHAVRIFFDVTATQEIVKEGDEFTVRVPDFVDPVARLRHPLPFAVLTRVEYLWGDTVRFEVTAVDNILRLDPGNEDELRFTTDALLVPAVQALFADVVTGRIEAAFLLGDVADTAFARYPENLRVGASLGVTF